MVVTSLQRECTLWRQTADHGAVFTLVGVSYIIPPLGEWYCLDHLQEDCAPSCQRHDTEQVGPHQDFVHLFSTKSLQIDHRIEGNSWRGGGQQEQCVHHDSIVGKDGAVPEEQCHGAHDHWGNHQLGDHTEDNMKGSDILGGLRKGIRRKRVLGRLMHSISHRVVGVVSGQVWVLKMGSPSKIALR